MRTRRPSLLAPVLLVLWTVVHAGTAAAADAAQEERRRPASYLGGALAFGQSHTFLAANDDHDDLRLGPLSTFYGTFRVGDALWDFLGLGFQFQFFNAKRDHSQISAFALLLDVTWYPWRGLGIRPSAGFGFGFAQGKNSWEFGFGGPGTLGLALLYEFRLGKRFTLAPITSLTWIGSEGYDGLFFLAGVELTTWFAPSRTDDPTRRN